MTLTPEQVALREAAQNAIATDGKPSAQIDGDYSAFESACGPYTILSLLAQLEAVPSVPAQTGTRTHIDVNRDGSEVQPFPFDRLQP